MIDMQVTSTCQCSSCRLEMRVELVMMIGSNVPSDWWVVCPECGFSPVGPLKLFPEGTTLLLSRVEMNASVGDFVERRHEYYGTINNLAKTVIPSSKHEKKTEPEVSCDRVGNPILPQTPKKRREAADHRSVSLDFD